MISVDELRKSISKWPQSDQALFIAAFVKKKPKEDIAHDLGIPLSMLERRIEDMARRLRS